MSQISIYLGSKCNANCTYCHRESTSENPFSAAMLQYLSRETAHSSTIIRFMGGEPTLYIDEMRQAMSYCHPATSYSLSTNGRLLNDDAVTAFLLDNNVSLTVSYDGTSGKRGYDNILIHPDYISNLQKFKKLNISTTLDRDNLDLNKLMIEFGDISNILKRQVRLYPHIMHVTSDKNRPLSLSVQDAHYYADQWISYVGKFIQQLNTYGVINLKTLFLFNYLWMCCHNRYEYGETYCFNRNLLKMDTQGNYYACLYIRDKRTYLGNIAEGKEAALQNMKRLVEELSPGCLACELYPYCGTACIMSQDHHIECLIQKKILTWFLNEIEKYRLQSFSMIDKLLGGGKNDRPSVCF